jgi:hypothetical protein
VAATDRLLGLDPAAPEARETISLVTASCRWEHDDDAALALRSSSPAHN